MALSKSGYVTGSDVAPYLILGKDKPGSRADTISIRKDFLNLGNAPVVMNAMQDNYVIPGYDL